MKVCTKCNKEKNVEDFSFRSKKKNTRQSWCKLCRSKYEKKLYSNPSTGRKKAIRKRFNNNKLFVREFLYRVKKISSCVKCGDNRHYVLEFHHREKKKFNISEGPIKGCSIDTLKKEIRKCDILCANCHREYHYFDREGSTPSH